MLIYSLQKVLTTAHAVQLQALARLDQGPWTCNLQKLNLVTASPVSIVKENLFALCCGSLIKPQVVHIFLKDIYWEPVKYCLADFVRQKAPPFGTKTAKQYLTGSLIQLLKLKHRILVNYLLQIQFQSLTVHHKASLS